MLNKGLRSEENQRINNILARLSTLVFVPENCNKIELENELNKIGVSLENLEKFSSDQLHSHLIKFNFDWKQMEEFADILVNWSNRESYGYFKSKAKYLYEFIQTQSKVFSFQIMNKINKL